MISAANRRVAMARSGWDEEVRAHFQAEVGPLNSTDPGALSRELRTHARDWDLVELSPRWKGRPVLIVSSDDAFAAEAEAVVAARTCGGRGAPAGDPSCDRSRVLGPACGAGAHPDQLARGFRGRRWPTRRGCRRYHTRTRSAGARYSFCPGCTLKAAYRDPGCAPCRRGTHRARARQVTMRRRSSASRIFCRHDCAKLRKNSCSGLKPCTAPPAAPLSVSRHASSRPTARRRPRDVLTQGLLQQYGNRKKKKGYRKKKK